MKCEYISRAEFYGVGKDFPFDRKEWICELEDEDNEIVREQILSYTEGARAEFTLDDEIGVYIYCEKCGKDIEFIVRIGDYFTKKEWKKLQKEDEPQI